MLFCAGKVDSAKENNQNPLLKTVFWCHFDSWRDVKNDFKYTTVFIACFLHKYKYFCLSKTEFDRPKKQIGYEGEEKKLKTSVAKM